MCQHQAARPPAGAPGPDTVTVTSSRPGHGRSYPRSETESDARGDIAAAGRPVLPRRELPDPGSHPQARQPPRPTSPLTAALAARIIAGLERL